MTSLLFCRQEHDLGVKVRARGLLTLPDSTSQKFLLLAQVSKHDQTKDVGRVVVIQLDFSKTRGRKCSDSDYEKWYARPRDQECLMGHKVCLRSIIVEEVTLTWPVSLFSNGTEEENQTLIAMSARSTRIRLSMRITASVLTLISSGMFATLPPCIAYSDDGPYP